MHTPAVARTYAARMTTAELQALQDTCLSIHANGGETSISNGTGNITINLTNCELILANIEEALRIQTAETASADPELTATPFTSGISYANRYIE